MGQAFYSTNDIAKIFGVKRTTVVYWILHKKLEAFRPTSEAPYRITRDALRLFIEGGSRGNKIASDEFLKDLDVELDKLAKPV